VSSLSLAGNLGRFTWVRYVYQPQEQRYLLLTVCILFSYVQPMVWLPVFGIFNVHTDVDAYEVDSGRKIPYRTWNSNSDVRLIDDGPLLSFQGRSSRASPSHASLSSR